MENKNRSIFSIHGITGMLIATVLLLSILGVLTYFGIMTQRAVANEPYTIDNPDKIKMIDKNNSNLKTIKEK